METMKRICLLTGASGALGTAFIERHAADYTILAVHHRNPVHFATQNQRFVDPLAPAEPVPANDHAVRAIHADLCDPTGATRVVDEVAAAVENVDVVINAAAIRAWSPLLAHGALDAFEDVFRTNVVAPLRLCAAVARRFWERDPEGNQRKNRNVVNISSTAGMFVYPDLGQAAYAASKAALNHLTYHLASELWNIGVRVNAVAPDTFPGRVDTNEVLAAIIGFDAGHETGRVVPLLGADVADEDGFRAGA
jgi:NAD(P)-dependent dehydrogenase (short-subunit alcohol dehydrogenase family)